MRLTECHKHAIPMNRIIVSAQTICIPNDITPLEYASLFPYIVSTVYGPVVMIKGTLFQHLSTNAYWTNAGGKYIQELEGYAFTDIETAYSYLTNATSIVDGFINKSNVTELVV